MITTIDVETSYQKTEAGGMDPSPFNPQKEIHLYSSTKGKHLQATDNASILHASQDPLHSFQISAISPGTQNDVH